jgi:hypothetical protein
MFKKFPHIEQFKHCIKVVRDIAKWNLLPVPTLTFTGTPKLHGTNACVGFNVQSGEFFYQSRERLIDINSDNAGFAMWASGSQHLRILITDVVASFNAKEVVHIFGEWAGKGVQSGVGISEFEKTFYIFGISVDDKWVELPNLPIECGYERIYFITQFPSYHVYIDFTQPELIQNKLVELTIEIENECPVTKALGKPGLIGEGIVWTSNFNGQHLMFKTKGEKHSSSKVKTLKELAPIDIEKMNSTKEFVEKCLSKNRLNQGIDKLREMGLDPDDVKNIGAYIKWCVDDVFREERDIIVESQFDSKVLGKELSNAARQFILNRL